MQMWERALYVLTVVPHCTVVTLHLLLALLSKSHPDSASTFACSQQADASYIPDVP